MVKKNVLVSDANHGGLILLEEYYKHTNNNLFFYDVYDKLSQKEKDDLCERFDVTFLSLDEIKADEDSFVKINPVHMPPVIGTDYSHHEFVGYLLGKYDYDFKIIQVTGVKGKTTVTSLIRDVLSNFNTLVLTSNGLTYNDTVLVDDLSIAPASIITAFNIVLDMGLVDAIDYCVFEVSLGVVPGNYLSVLTNILEDYSIGRGSSSASVAKGSVFSSEIAVCDFGAYLKYYDEFSAVTLSLDDMCADVFASNINFDIENTAFVMNYFNETYLIHHFALSDFYINNLLFAICVGLLLNIDVDEIISNLSKSRDIRGRNSYKKIGDKTIIEDINPGLNTTSIKKCINNLEKYETNPQIIIGGDYGITCEEIDEEKLVKIIKNTKNKNIILAGKLGENINNKLENKYKHYPTLTSAINHALTETENKLIQIIYRSEYTKHDKELNYTTTTKKTVK